MHVSMLKSLDVLVCDVKVHPSVDIAPKLVTLRFSDHRGLKPDDIKITDNTFDAPSTRSKRTGDEKKITIRPVHVEGCCYFVNPLLLSTGWSLLQTTASYERDYLPTSTSDN